MKVFHIRTFLSPHQLYTVHVTCRRQFYTSVKTRKNLEQVKLTPSWIRSHIISQKFGETKIDGMGYKPSFNLRGDRDRLYHFDRVWSFHISRLVILILRRGLSWSTHSSQSALRPGALNFRTGFRKITIDRVCHDHVHREKPVMYRGNG
jgi:hypothetical protein